MLNKASSSSTDNIVRCRSMVASVCDVMCRIGESGGDWGDPCWGDKWGHRGCRGLGCKQSTNVYSH